MNAVDDAVFNALAAGTALTTALGGTESYCQLATQGAALPYVVFFQSSGLDENSSPRRARRMMYTVKAVSDDQDEAGDLDAYLDALLHESTLTVTGYGNYRTYRENDIEYVEQTLAGLTVYHRGAQYGIWIAE